MTQILGTPDRKTIKLGDKEYRLSQLNLNVLTDIEEGFDCSIDKVGKMLDKKRASALRRLVHILLKQEYPDMTLEKIGGLIDLSNMAEISQALAKVLAGD